MKRFFGRIGAFLGTPAGVILTANVIWQLVVWKMKIASGTIYMIASGVILILDIVFAFTLREQLIHFFSQFILPIQNPKHRREIAARVANFDTGRRGPALFVKNGRVIEHESEKEMRGAGLIILDTASAVVLRTATQIRDTAGPGIKFTQANEWIAGSVDLRAQWQFIGPLASDQPFLNPLSSPEEVSDIESRHQETNGWTRDGFEVSPTISIKFRIQRPTQKVPDESGVTSQYGYNPEAVRNAITREVIQLDTSENRQIRLDWNKLPAHLVVNLWREYIRKFKLNDLFTSTGHSGLQVIEEMMNKRVKNPHVEGLDDTGMKTGEWINSLEFRQLQQRGLEIIEVRIHNILFDHELEEQIIQNWNAEWMRAAQKEAEYITEMESLLGTAARSEASKSFARMASRQFGGKVTSPQGNQFKTLQLLILPLKEFILNESASGSAALENELKKLDEVWKWLLDNSLVAGGDDTQERQP